ncbi:hypothetical protein ASA1KI_41800 [Opitutales bacterium ASA1]|nr:hypothetical protein ASA1KI_41800 [Opitutales bacterium ASA1]
MATATVLALFAGAVQASAQMPTVQYKGHEAHATRILAQVKAGTSLDEQVATLARERVLAARDYALVPGLVMLEIDEPVAVMSAGETPEAIQTRQAQRLHATIEALQRSGLYEYVEPDYIVRPHRVPTDAAFTDGRLWGLRNTGQNGGSSGVDIDAVRAWDITTGSSDVIVAVIDSGIRYTHQDLAANMWRNPGEIPGNGIDDDGNGFIDDVHGINAVNDSGDPMDDDGHGTHVAGTIGAVANNAGEHVGVAWNVRLMALKFFNASGGGTYSDLLQCYDYAVAHGAHVINCSFGSEASATSERRALEAARDRGVLVVASAGNESSDSDVSPRYPANYDLSNIIAVAAIDRTGARASFSNYGATTVHLGAPGVSILSTYYTSDSAYTSANGTSMAAPHVAGIAALVRAQFPGISVGDLRERIVNTTTATSSMQGRTISGGRVNAHSALTATASGRLVVTVAPKAGTTLFHGRATPFVVRVRDLIGVTGATVTGTLSTGGTITFRDNGVAPDTVAGDGNYSAYLSVPASGTQMSLTVTATAPGKTAGSTTGIYTLQAPPANDRFADRAVISNVDTAITTTNVGASIEPGEPKIAGQNGGASLWWTWTSPANATVTISTEGSDFDTLLGVYTGNAVNALTEVASNDDIDGPNQPSRVTFSGTAGTIYQIAVDGWEGKTGNITLRITTAVPPANDNFANRFVLVGSPASGSGTVANASFETGEPDHREYPRVGSIWWEWTAPSSGTARLTHGWDTMSAVYVGASLGELQAVPTRYYDDQYSGATFAVTAGTVYQFAILGVAWNPGATAEIGVSISPAPVNDHFENRIVLTGNQVSASGSNENATRQPGEPRIGEYGAGATVWWTWTAPTSGTVVIETSTTTFGAAMAVYTGDTLAGLQKVASGSEWSPRVAFSAAAGVTYQIAVDGNGSGTGTLNFNLSLLQPPPNDHFGGRAVLSGTDIDFGGTLVGATRETGDPGVGRRETVWWTWTAPTTGTVEVRRLQYHGAIVRIFTGSSLAGLEQVVDSAYGFSDVVARFHGVGGVTYSILVEQPDHGGVGAFDLNLRLQDAPPNDMFANRAVLSGRNATAQASNALATIEAGEPYHGYSGQGGATLWWTWTAPASGTAIIEISNAFIPVVVYTGSTLSTLSRAQFSESSPGATRSVSFTAASGTTYQIVVTDHYGSTSAFTLDLELVDPPANDLFADRAVLTGAEVQVTTSNRGATREPNEPQNWDGGSSSLWWTWTAPHDGTVTVSTSGSAIDTILRVYTGTSLANLDFVGYDRRGDGESRIVFSATAGSVYQISVDGGSGAFGDIVLNLSLAVPPTNDRFAQRTELTGSRVLVEASNAGATREEGEPWHAYSSVEMGSVWYTWTAPATGSAVVLVESSRIMPLTVVYRGTQLGSLTTESSTWSNDSNRKAFRAIAGVSYQIVVAGFEGSRGDFTLTLQFDPSPANDDFVNSTAITFASGTVQGTLRGATRQPDEPGVRGYYALESSAWWSWTAAADGALLVSAQGEGTEVHFAVFQGSSISSLTVPTSRSVTLSDGSVGYAYAVTQGMTLRIVVAGANAMLVGDVSLTLEFVTGPAHDRFAERATLSGETIRFTSDNFGAGREPGEPAYHGGPQSGASLWWTWTAPRSGTVEIQASSTDFYVGVAVFEGVTLAGLVPHADSEVDRLERFRFPAEAGRTYVIAVYALDGPGGSFDFSLSLVDGPTNDMFENRIELSGSSIRQSGTNRHATIENGESALVGESHGASLWWTWTAPAAGRVILDLDRLMDAHFRIHVFSGSVLSSLTPVDGRRLGPFGNALMFDAEEGAVYQIVVSSRGHIDLNFSFSLHHGPAPANDLFVNRTILSGDDTRITGSNRGAEGEPGEPELGYGSGGNSVWWSWTPSTGGTAMLDARGVDQYLVFRVFTGSSFSTFSEVELIRRPLQGSGHGRYVFPVVGGTTYQIAMGGTLSRMGEVDCSLSVLQRPENDAFDAASVLTGEPLAVVGDNLGASLEPDEPSADDYSTPGGSVWWRWTSPFTGPVAVSTLGSDFDTLLAVYTGESLATLTRVAANNDDIRVGRTSRVVFPAVEGRTYHIAVDGAFGDMGEIALAVEAWQGAVGTIDRSAATVAAGGSLTLTANIDESGPFTYRWMRDGIEIVGASGATLPIRSLQRFHAGVYHVFATNAAGVEISASVEVQAPEVVSSDSRMLNLSTRAMGFSGDDALIPGFVINGPGTRRLLLRAMGPGLAEFGVQDAMPDPKMILRRSVGTAWENVAESNDWEELGNLAEMADAVARVGAVPFAQGAKDSALLIDLGAGAYTVVVEDTARRSGVANVELFDAGTNPAPSAARLSNLSNRGWVGSGAAVMIPGFVVSDEGPKTVLLRAVGPGLTTFGVQGVLRDPNLTLYQANAGSYLQEPILWNDNWGENGDAADIAAVAEQVGAFALEPGSKDAAFVITLQPGVYTVHAAGADGGTGVALVELYLVD